MPMSDAGMGSAIYTALVANGNPTNATDLENFCNALGKAIVEYIKANAQVAEGIPVSTSSGSGETTAPGTIS